MRQNGNQQSFVSMLVVRHTGERRYPFPTSSRRETSLKPAFHTTHRTWSPAFAGMTDGIPVTPPMRFVQAMQFPTHGNKKDTKFKIINFSNLRVLRDLRGGNSLSLMRRAECQIRH